MSSTDLIGTLLTVLGDLHESVKTVEKQRMEIDRLNGIREVLRRVIEIKDKEIDDRDKQIADLKKPAAPLDAPFSSCLQEKVNDRRHTDT